MKKKNIENLIVEQHFNPEMVKILYNQWKRLEEEEEDQEEMTKISSKIRRQGFYTFLWI